MALRRGGKAAEQEAAFANFSRMDYFRLKSSGDSMVLRFLDEAHEWPYTRQHNMVPTKAKPADWPENSKYPATMGAVCRRDKSFSDPSEVPHYTECFICDTMVKPDGKKYTNPVRLWARAVVREPVYDEGTKELLGYRDAEHEVSTKDEKDNDVKKMVKKIVVVNMATKNFFGAMQGYADIYGTVLDRDYHVTRKGMDTDTDYNIVPLDVDPDHNLKKTPGLRDKYEAFAKEASATPEDVEKMIYDLASDDFYARFFDTTKQAPPFKGKKKGDEGKKASSAPAPSGGAPAAEQAKPADSEDEFSAERLEKMKNRVLQMTGGGVPAEQPTMGES